MEHVQALDTIKAAARQLKATLTTTQPELNMQKKTGSTTSKEAPEKQKNMRTHNISAGSRHKGN